MIDFENIIAYNNIILFINKMKMHYQLIIEPFFFYFLITDNYCTS